MQVFKRPRLLLLFLPPILLLLHPFTPVDGGRILAFPGEYSHWLNMRTIMEELVRRNHSVTILVSDASPSVNYNNSRDAAKFNFIVFKVPYSRAEIHSVTKDFIDFSMYKWHKSSILQKSLKIFELMQSSTTLGQQQCDAMLKNDHLMATLREAAFDAVLLDPMIMCSDLVADMLGLPFIVSLRFSFGGAIERHCGHMPAPPSFVPAAPLPYTDRMTFRERVINMVMFMYTSVVSELYWKLMLDRYYSEVKGSPTTVCKTLGNADIWLMRTFWDIETPRPFPPNFKYVGGLHCKPASPLPEDMEAFVQSSGDAGVVVVSFGSMVVNVSTERADVIAAAFGRIPQKVIWRYRGEKPRTLAANTKLYDWIPQNDLLGHPKTRAFVTHGGTNGLYEAVFHGVPLVGVPLFGDQSDNLGSLSRRGAAIILDFNHLTTDELKETLDTVINQPSYKSSMRHLSEVHRDRPMTALNTAVFWVEFVMRNGGARHLRLASHDLYWFQYYSLDTGAALLAAVTAIAAFFWMGFCCLVRRCRRRTRREKSD